MRRRSTGVNGNKTSVNGVGRDVTDVLGHWGRLPRLHRPALLRATNPPWSVRGAPPTGGPGSEPRGCFPTKVCLRLPAASPSNGAAWAQAAHLAPSGSWPRPCFLSEAGLRPSMPCGSCTEQSLKLPASGSRAAHSLHVFPTQERSSERWKSCPELKCAVFPKGKEMSRRKYYKKGLNLSAVQTL